MINTDEKHLMFIEPAATEPEEPVGDEFAELADALLDHADPGPPEAWLRGTHTCACGERSDNKPWRIAGVLTNSLLPHYVREHRSEVPPEELEKMQRIAVLVSQGARAGAEGSPAR